MAEIRSRASSKCESSTVEIDLHGTKRLEARQIAIRRDQGLTNLNATAIVLLQALKRFCTQHGHLSHHPSYAFDEFGQPRPTIQEALSVFEHYAPLPLGSNL